MATRLISVKVKSDRPQIAKTRIELAAELGVGRRAVENYDRIARAYIADYLELCKGKNGRVQKRLPLMPFQQHCIKYIAQQFKLTRCEHHVVRFIRANPDLFSLSQYTRFVA